MVSQEKKEEKKERERRKEARKAKSAQLPAHGEVQKMEHSLLKLLNEFNSGQLRAFDSVYSLEQMESVRNQQEAIARKHFELGAAQVGYSELLRFEHCSLQLYWIHKANEHITVN